MVSKFHHKFSEDLELIYAKYTNPFDGAPELTLSTCDLPENVHILENYNYSNCGKWKVLEGDCTDAYEVYQSPAAEETPVLDNDSSVEDNNDTSDDEYQSSRGFILEKSFREKHPHTESHNTSLKNIDVSKIMPSNHKIYNLAPTQLCYKSDERNSEIELSRQDSSDEYFKLETVTISKDLWTQVQQCLHLMTSVFSQLNSENSDKRLSQRQPMRSSDTPQCIPQGLVVEKVFVRHKALGCGSDVELASRQSFLHDSKTKITEIGSVDASTKDNNQAESNRASLAKKRQRRYRLVRRRSASSQTQEKSSNKIPTSEQQSGRQENLHAAKRLFDMHLSDTDDDFHVHKRTPVKDWRESKHCASPESDDVMLLEAPSPVVDTELVSPQTTPRNRKSGSTISPQKKFPYSTLNTQAACGHETLFENCCSAIKRSQEPTPLFPQHRNKSLEKMPSPIRCTLNANLTESLENNTVTNPCLISLTSPGAIHQREISVNSLRNDHIPERTSTFNCNKGKADDTKKQHVEEVNLAPKGSNVSSQHGNLIPSNVRPAGNPKIICNSNYSGQNQYANKHNGYSTNHRHSSQLQSTPRRAKFHPYATCNKSRTPPPYESLNNKAPSLISPFQKFTIKSPSSPHHKWTTLDRSPSTLCGKQARRMSDLFALSRKNLEFGDMSSDNEKIRAQEETGFSEVKRKSTLNYPGRKLKTQQNNPVEDDQLHSSCLTGQCTKTFCFNCSMDLS